MINLQDNILLVDTYFAIYHKYFAIRKWHTLSQKSPSNNSNAVDDSDNITYDINYDWMNDKVFLDKYNELFMSNILKACKKYNIPAENIIFAIDCNFNRNWRYNEAVEYKGTRLDNHKKNSFNSYDIFGYTIKKTLKIYAKKYNFACISIPCCEADDIIAGCVKYINNYKNNIGNGNLNGNLNANSNIYIYSADNDFVQLCNNNVKLIDYNSVITSDRYLNNGNEYCLFRKILIGDLNDNIKNITICVKTSEKLPTNTIITNKNYKSNKKNKNLASAIKSITCTKNNINDILNNTDFYNNLKSYVYSLRSYMHTLPVDTSSDNMNDNNDTSDTSDNTNESNNTSVTNDIRAYIITYKMYNRNINLAAIETDIEADENESAETIEPVTEPMDVDVDVVVIDNNNNNANLMEESENAAKNAAKNADEILDDDNDFTINLVKLSSKNRTPKNMKAVDKLIKNKIAAANNSNGANPVYTSNKQHLTLDDIFKCDDDNCPIEFKKVLKLPKNNYIKTHIKSFMENLGDIDATLSDLQLKNAEMLSKLTHNILLIDFEMIPQYYMLALYATLDRLII